MRQMIQERRAKEINEIFKKQKLVKTPQKGKEEEDKLADMMQKLMRNIKKKREKGIRATNEVD